MYLIGRRLVNPLSTRFPGRLYFLAGFGGNESVMEELTIQARIRVRLTPRSARAGLAGWQDGDLKVRVTEPPIDGKANAALERLLAGVLDLPKKSVRVVAGSRGRAKTVAIDGLSQDETLRRLREAAPK